MAVDGDGLLQTAGSGLESPLNDVVRLAAAELTQVQGTAGTAGEGQEELLHQLRIKGSHLLRGDLESIAQIGAAAQIGGGESFLRTALSLQVFRERGLISLSTQGDSITICLNPIQGKVDLNACPYLMRLQDDTSRN